MSAENMTTARRVIPDAQVALDAIERERALLERVRVLEAAVPEDPWVRTFSGGNRCYVCGAVWAEGPHRPDCAWLAARGEP
jgi:hypothetical protein